MKFVENYILAEFIEVYIMEKYYEHNAREKYVYPVPNLTKFLYWL